MSRLEGYMNDLRAASAEYWAEREVLDAARQGPVDEEKLAALQSAHEEGKKARGLLVGAALEVSAEADHRPLGSGSSWRDTRDLIVDLGEAVREGASRVRNSLVDRLTDTARENVLYDAHHRIARTYGALHDLYLGVTEKHETLSRPSVQNSFSENVIPIPRTRPRV